jgi:hypothetical protein
MITSDFIKKIGMKDLTDLDFVEKRIVEQNEYLEDLEKRKRWKKDITFITRLDELRESARHQLTMFEGVRDILIELQKKKVAGQISDIK